MLAEEKGKIVKRLKENKLQPQVYVITLSQGETKSTGNFFKRLD